MAGGKFTTYGTRDRALAMRRDGKLQRRQQLEEMRQFKEQQENKTCPKEQKKLHAQRRMMARKKADGISRIRAKARAETARKATTAQIPQKTHRRRLDKLTQQKVELANAAVEQRRILDREINKPRAGPDKKKRVQPDKKRQHQRPAVARQRGFIPCSCFEGAKLGYLFKKDRKGVGYYRDFQSEVDAEDVESSPSPTASPLAKRNLFSWGDPLAHKPRFASEILASDRARSRAIPNATTDAGEGTKEVPEFTAADCAKATEPVEKAGEEETEQELMKKFVDMSLNGTTEQTQTQKAAQQPESVSKVAQNKFMQDLRAGANMAMKHSEEEAGKIRKALAVANRKAEIARRRAAFNSTGNDGAAVH